MARFLFSFFALCLFFSFAAASIIRQCDQNESLLGCGKVCESSCSKKDIIDCDYGYRFCRLECGCTYGYYRKESTGTCVTWDQCPRIPTK